MKKRVFLFALLFVFALSACNNSSTAISSTLTDETTGTDESLTTTESLLPLGSDAYITDSGDILFDGLNGSLTLKSSVDSINLESYIHVSDGASWTLSLGDDTATIDNKTLNLEYGLNLYNITVTSEDKNTENTYKLSIYRNHMYKVNYITNTDMVLNEVSIEEDDLLTEPDLLTKTGYTFISWDYDFSNPVKSDLTITASWAANTYLVSYDVNGGDELENNSLSVTYDASYELDIPSRKGYTFDGWMYNESLFTDGIYKYEGNITITAKWNIIEYSIEYYLNGGTAESNPITYNYESDIITIINPVKTGYTFTGWSVNGSEELYLNYEIKHNSYEKLILSANYEINQYTITYDTDGGTLLSPVTLDYMSEVVVPSIPEKTGYTFTGWDKSIPETMPAEDMIIKALWKANQYTLTIKYNDGVTEDLVLTQDYGSIISVKDPERTYYTFTGYSKEIPSTMPAENMVVEAMWKINQYTLTIKYNDGVTEDLVLTQDYDSLIDVENPLRTGYTFNGWNEELPIKMPAENIIREATWQVNQYTLTIKFNDGVTENLVLTQDYGSSIDASVNTPSVKGYSFTGWSESIPSTMPAENKVIEALFICQVKYSVDKSNGYVTINGLNTDGIDITILSQYEGYKTLIINEGCFMNSNITSAFIPDTVTEIKKWAFYHCEKLKNITLSANLNIIGNEAFIGCKNLSSVSIPSNVTTIGESAFKGCTSLTSITVPNSVTSLGQSAFDHCTNLKNITLSSNISEIKEYTFNYCSSLEIIVIPANVTSIGQYAFASCSLLKKITLSNKVTTISSYAFKTCNKLITIEYNGTKDEWNAITKESNWNKDASPWGYDVYCSDGTISI